MAVPRFPQMVANSREVTWSPPAGTGRLQASGQLKDAALAPAVLQVLEARGCDDAAAVRRHGSSVERPRGAGEAHLGSGGAGTLAGGRGARRGAPAKNLSSVGSDHFFCDDESQ